MSKDTEKNLFIVFSMPRLYQHLSTRAVSYRTLANGIIDQIKAAHAFRRTERVRDLSRLLLNIPVNEYQLIAQYYLVWCDLRESKYDTESLESIIDNTQTYKTKALSTRAAFEVNKRQPDAAMYFYTEALKSSPTISEYIHISRAIAVLKAQEGFHDSALKDLESLIPITRHAEPLICYDVLNSYAAQLFEAKRKNEARNIIKHVIASPFAFAYPEWQETAQELKESSRSLIGVDHSPYAYHNVLAMPVTKHGNTEQISYNRPARVLNLQQWKKKMGKELNGDERHDKDAQEMGESEMIYKIISLFTNPATSPKKRLEMLEAVEKIAAKSDTPTLNKPEPDESKSDDPQGA